MHNACVMDQRGGRRDVCGRGGCRTRSSTIRTPRNPDSVSPAEFEELAHQHLDGVASDEDAAFLEANVGRWAEALDRLLDDVEDAIDHARKTVTGAERELVLSDYFADYDRIDDVLTRLAGPPPGQAQERSTSERPAKNTGKRSEPAADVQQDRGRQDEPDEPEDLEPGVVQLQLSWADGHLLAWAGGRNAEPENAKQVIERLTAAGSSPNGWVEHDPVTLPDGQKAETVRAPVESTLGWLVSVAGSAQDETVAPSVTWMGLVAALAVRLVARGRMIPQLDKVSTSSISGGKGANQGWGFAVRWTPALIDHDELTRLSRALPGAVSVLEQRRDARTVCRSVLTAFVDAICRDAARRFEVPAPPPKPRSASEVSEAVLARLDGQPFEAPNQHGAELSRNLQGWAKPVLGTSKLQLIIRLDPPDDGNAWYLAAYAPDNNGKLEAVDAAMSNASNARRDTIKRQLERLEALYEPFDRGKAKRRGEVILSQDEAWALMTVQGRMLGAAGFEVRVPPLRRRKAKAGLKMTAFGSAGESVVGAQQLTTVQWSAVFDDVELTAEDIRRLANESRPLVKSHGRWVEVDHADLEAAAAALAERAKKTQFTGADMLRHALGLEESPLAGGFQVSGEGWAAELMQSARNIPDSPTTTPEGFKGELRSYQADALAWLGFLDGAGLGGCLALDMGLGKTPTMLAHLALSTEHGPALVIAPPAVVGNWASEARKFVPGLRVLVHHGQDRAEGSRIAKEIGKVDLVISTYGTAVRDIGHLDEIAWGKVVLDEAQVIKNHTSETAQQLRRLNARTRVVLTGTPIENGLGDLWSLMDFVNPGLVGERSTFIAQLSADNEDKRGESALHTLNGVLVFRRTKMEPAIAAELPDRIDELDHCPMTPEQIGLYQAVLDDLVKETADTDAPKKKGAVLAAITALKQICNHPEAYNDEGGELAGRSGKLARLNEIVDNVFANDEKVLIFTHFAAWGEKLSKHLTERTGVDVECYHGGLARGARDKMIERFQAEPGKGALVLSLKAGGTGLNLTAANHVVLYDRWWNPAVEDQARDRAWRIGQTKTVIAHRLVCPGTVDERVEEVVAGKRQIADMVLPKSSSVGDLDASQLQRALGIDQSAVLTEDDLEEVVS